MPGRADDTLPLQHVAIYGASGSGKTLFARALLRSLRGRGHVWFWDPDNSHGCAHVARSPSEWLSLLQRGKGGAFAYPASPAAFDFWCRSIWAVASADAPCIAVVEELGQVTRPGKAPASWHQLVTRGRKYAVQLVTIAQRPAEADKTILSNKRVLAVGYLDRRADRDYVANELDESEEAVQHLARRNQKTPAMCHLWVRDAGQPARMVAVPVNGSKPRGL